MAKKKYKRTRIALSLLFISGRILASPDAGYNDTAPGMNIPGTGSFVGLGADNRVHLRGEVSHVFSGDEQSAWIGEAWFGRKVGGVKLNRHWLIGEAAPNSAVGKLFTAWDRNASGDQKLTLGGGMENESWFWGTYGAFGLSGRRETGTSTFSSIDTVLGTDPLLGPFRENVTTTTTVRSFEKAYDYGLGARLGRFYSPLLMRLTAGLDHEWGKASSSQSTYSLSLEKYFVNSPHSIFLNLTSAHKHGEFEMVRNEQRVGIFWRYAFDIKQQGATERRLDAPAPATPLNALATTAAKKADDRTPENLAAKTHAFEVFFKLGQTEMQPDAHTVLDEIVRLSKAAEGPYTLVITGHTCDLGNERFNQQLSEKRARNVRDYLVLSGIGADRVVADGKGETDSKYPNTRNERYKNRRCEVELTVAPAKSTAPGQAVGSLVQATLPVVREAEAARPSAWVSRALYNTVRHKQEVDVYRTQETSTTTVTGNRVYLNRPPQAVNDRIVWLGSQMPTITDVLVNDTDPDNDPLRVISVTNGTHGDATIRSDGKIQYVVHKGWEGVDFFTYTISDGKGGTSTATVTVAIIDP